MAGGVELLEFVAVLLGVPIILSFAAAFILRSRVPSWSRRKKAWTFALVGPSIELAIAVWFMVSGAMSECPPDNVCDTAGLATGIGLLLVLAAAVAYLLSAISTYRILPHD
jgi:hypothetical protein